MKEFCVMITADSRKEGQVPKCILVNKAMSFNEFRRKCSEALKMDVVSIFSTRQLRITDIQELEKEKDVLASENFYPLQTSFSFLNDQSMILKSQNTTKSNSESNEKRKQGINLEIYARPKSGKTSLIWKFVKNEIFSGETNSIIEAVYEKEVDVEDQTLTLSITDVKELDDSRNFEDRARDKDVIVLLAPKLDLRESKEWLRWALSRAKTIPSNPLIVVVISKCDQRFGENSCREVVQNFEKEVLVLKTSIYENSMFSDIKYAEELFLQIARNFVKRKNSDEKIVRNSVKSVSVRQRKLSKSNSSWLYRPFESIGSCFGNMFR